jgi:hypothetical protein
MTTLIPQLGDLHKLCGRFAFLPRTGEAAVTESVIGRHRAGPCRVGRKTMSVKHASDLAARLSIPAGATLVATFIVVAAALTAQVF